MRILIIGAESAIGKATAKLLAVAGHTLSVEPPDLDCDDPATLVHALEGQDAVLCAAPIIDAIDPDAAIIEAFTRARNLIAALRRARVHRLLYIGDAMSVGRVEGDTAATETDLYTPGSPGLSLADAHYAAETELLAATSPTLYVTTLLPTHTIGGGDSSLDPDLLRALTSAPPRILVETACNLVDVRDVARSAHNALKQGRPGQRYILSGHTVALSELVRLLREEHHLDLHTRVIDAPAIASARRTTRALSALGLNSLDPRLSAALYNPHQSLRFDRTKAKVELGHNPRKLERSLASSIEWIRDNVAQPKVRSSNT